MSRSAPLRSLREQIKVHGWCRKASGPILLQLLLHIALSLGGIVAFVVSDSLLIRICAMIVSTAGSIGVGTNTHTSSHYATSDKRWLNELLTFFGYPFYLGVSATHWWYRHVVLHHPSPNVLGVDSDVDLSPWFALTREEITGCRGAWRWYYEKVQWLVFPFALAVNGLNMQLVGWRHLIRSLTKHDQRKPVHYLDLTSLCLHLATNLGLPMIYFAPSHVLLFYLLRFGLIGYAMFAVLAPAHFPAEAARIRPDQEECDFILLQTATIVNYRTGFIGRFMCSGLQFQIEHHLFPNVSHVFYPRISRLVERFCLENGFPYRSYRWEHALWKCWAALRSPPPVTPSLESLRKVLLTPNGQGKQTDRISGAAEKE